MIKHYTFIAIILLSAKLVFAQADTSKKSSDRINVFDRNTKTGSANLNDLNKSGTVKKLNAFKINPFLLANGEIPVFYERELGNDFALQAGVGLTLKDYVQSLFDTTDGILAPPKGLLSNAPEVWKTGVCFNAGIRYYFDDVMDGLYISADVGYRSNPIQFPEIIYDVYGNQTSSGPTTYYNGSYHNIDFKILLGGEYSLFDSDHLLIEWYAGIGLRSYSVNYFDDISGLPAQATTLKPRIYFGYTLGYKI
jgi:hypothetical protein